MSAPSTGPGPHPTNWVVPLWGILTAAGGMTHGVGELRQGSTAPGGVVFNSWVDGPIADNLGGEPAMTIVPNLAVTGVLTILVALAIAAFAVASIRRPGRPGVLLLLYVGLLLVGGGFAPPVIGVLAALAGTAVHARRGRWSRHPEGRLVGVLAALWPWTFWLCLLGTVFLVLGSLALAVLFDVNAPSLFVYSLFLVMITLPAVAVTGIAHAVRTIDARPLETGA